MRRIELRPPDRAAASIAAADQAFSNARTSARRDVWNAAVYCACGEKIRADARISLDRPSASASALDARDRRFAAAVLCGGR